MAQTFISANRTNHAKNPERLCELAQETTNPFVYLAYFAVKKFFSLPLPLPRHFCVPRLPARPP
jgi:hypothetical protein